MTDVIPKEDIERRQQSNKAGRYTLEEAAALMELETGERADDVLKMLMEAAKSRALTVYEPGKNVPYGHGNDFASRVREFYEEAHYDDLNAWLADNCKRIEWRFPEPATLVTEPASEKAQHKTKIGVTSAEIIKKFHLEEKWVSRLSHNDRHNKHLKVTLVTAGRRGKGKGANLWNPAQFALMLLNHEKDNMKRLNTIMEGKFPEWLDQWCEISGLDD